jgi:hypothetical protein
MANWKRPLFHTVYSLLLRIPGLNRLVRRWKVNRDFHIERRVLKGIHRSPSTERSILFFSIYRGGSTFVGELMKKIAREVGLTPVDLDGYFFSLGRGKEWEGQGRVRRRVPYQPRGYFYGPFRSFNRGISNLEDFKILLVLRDPRDVIVSSYYSIYSHVTPMLEGKRALRVRMKRRKKTLEQSVDEFAINKLEANSRFLDRYQEYYRELLNKPNVLFLKYEDMVGDFSAWLDRLIRFLELDLSGEFIRKLKAGADFKVSKEDVYKHKRQVTPGDHSRKLKPGTIEILNTKTGEIRQFFGY